jgi:hypothetical protein
MSILCYGSVYLNLLKTNYYKRENVLVGNKYAYTRHTISVRATINPFTQKDLFQGHQPFRAGVIGPRPLPQVRPGPTLNAHVGKLVPPGSLAVTEPPFMPGAYLSEVVKHVLMQPGLQLRWAISGYPLVVSPLPGFICDSTGGPKPVSCDVIGIHGGKTVEVDYVIQTDINEYPRFTKPGNPILAHQWSDEHDIGPDFYLLRTIRGRVVFDAALVRTKASPFGPTVNGRSTADAFRRQLMHPVLKNMKRDRIKVKLLEDGVTLDYEITDRETALIIPYSKITRVEGIHAVRSGVPDWNLQFYGISVNMHAVAAISRDKIPIGGPGIAMFMKGGKLGDIYDTALKGLAVSQHFFHVKAYGHRKTRRRDDIEAFLRSLITDRLAPIKAKVKWCLNYEVIHNINGTDVEAKALYIGPPLEGGDDRAIPTTYDKGRLPSFAIENYGPPASTAFTTDTLFDNAKPPEDGGSRGHVLEELVAAALEDSGSTANTVPPPTPHSSIGPPAIAPTAPFWPEKAPWVPPGE